MRSERWNLILLAVVWWAVLPSVAAAQSGIAGVVKDTTGAVLPGVTVEAASPALIEKVRTVVTDDQGQYKIVDLRPGLYTVTCTLTGFNTVKREGIELTTNFTANVNAELRVGALEETVTVSGQSPVVDVQNVVQQRTVQRELIAALPTGSRNQQNIAALIPGIVNGAVSRPSAQDVGGSAGDMHHSMAIHGGRQADENRLIEGIPYNAMTGVNYGGVNPDSGGVEEYSYELGAISVEGANGGVRANVIPREGSNRFAGYVYGDVTNHNLQNDNSDDRLKARGLGAVNHLNKVWDLNPSFGGAIKQDTLWFYLSTRYWGLQDQVAGMFYDTNPLDFVYTPDQSRRAIDDSWLASASLRPTWQITPKNKLSAFLLDQGRCLCHVGVSATTAPEAARRGRSAVDYLTQATWTSTITNKLLLEASAQRYRFEQSYDRQPEVTENTYSVTELSTALNFGASPAGQFRHDSWIYNYRGVLSYVTGSHAAKVGFTLQQGKRNVHQSYPGDVNLQLLNGVPRSVIVNATPYDYYTKLNAALGLFAQDQWTIKHLTVTGGVRFDHHNSSVPEQHLPAVRFVGPRDFAAIDDVPNWNDLSPRVGASYDLFGNGKTALKVTLSRYVAGETIQFATNVNPVNTSVSAASRTWTDLNGDFIPQDNELGPLSNANFGKVNVATRYDDDIREGFGKRGFNWETSASVQHELMPQVSVNAAYFRRRYGNFLATDNLLVSPADYDPFCITVPVDSRLPGGGGNQICGLYDIKPAKFGQVSNLVTFAKNYGKQYEYWHGFDLTMNARLPHGALLSGGVSIGRTVADLCDVAGKVENPAVAPAGNATTATTVPVVASPSQLYCHQATPFQPQVKLLGTYNLPWDVQAAATFQSLAGPEITASYVATNDQVKASLGRDLAAGARATVTVPLISPATMYDDRLYQLDVRFAKIFKVGRTRIKGNFDFYNALNANPVLLVNARFGPAWLSPTYVLPGRLFKFGGQIDF